jgi:hypothetical protein
LRVAGGSASANVPALQQMLGHDAVHRFNDRVIQFSEIS